LRWFDVFLLSFSFKYPQQIIKSFKLKQLALFLFLSISYLSIGNKGLTSDEVIEKLNKKLENSENPSYQIFQFINNELKIGIYASPSHMVESYRRVEKIHQSYQDVYYLQGLCLLTFRLQLVSKKNEAYYFLYKANKISDQVKLTDEKYLKLFYNINSSSSFFFMQYEKADKYSLQELNCKVNKAIDSISIYNMLGLIQKKLNNLDKSLYYHAKGLAIAQRNNEEFWQGLISGNMGYIYLEKKEYKKARKLCEFDYKFSLKSNELESAATALAAIVLIDLADNKIEQAKLHFNQIQLIKITNPSFSHKQFIEKSKYQLLEKLGDYKQAFASYKLYNSLSDSIEKDRAQENMKRTEFQIKFEQENAKLSILEERNKNNEVIFYGVVLFTILGIISLIIILFQVVKRRNRERFISLLQKKRLDDELARTEKEMRQILDKLIEKNELITLLNSELELIQDTSTTETVEKSKLKDKLSTFKLLTEDDWIEFKRLFAMLNPNFFEKLHNHFRDLTSAEIRLITLSKLNLDTTEISRALGISPDSVRKTNLRLRKKVGIENQEELTRLILSI
jgi:DNA-binding CsgD family transcriptional regulator